MLPGQKRRSLPSGESLLQPGSLKRPTGLPRPGVTGHPPARRWPGGRKLGRSRQRGPASEQRGWKRAARWVQRWIWHLTRIGCRARILPSSGSRPAAARGKGAAATQQLALSALDHATRYITPISSAMTCRLPTARLWEMSVSQAARLLTDRASRFRTWACTGHIQRRGGLVANQELRRCGQARAMECAGAAAPENWCGNLLVRPARAGPDPNTSDLRQSHRAPLKLFSRGSATVEPRANEGSRRRRVSEDHLHAPPPALRLRPAQRAEMAWPPISTRPGARGANPPACAPPCSCRSRIRPPGPGAAARMVNVHAIHGPHNAGARSAALSQGADIEGLAQVESLHQHGIRGVLTTAPCAVGSDASRRCGCAPRPQTLGALMRSAHLARGNVDGRRNPPGWHRAAASRRRSGQGAAGSGRCRGWRPSAPRVGMAGAVDPLASCHWAHLHDAPGVHHGHTVAVSAITPMSWVIQEHRRALLAAQAPQQRHDLRLGRHTSRAVVGSSATTRPAAKARRNHHPLPHAARQLMRVLAQPALGGRNAGGLHSDRHERGRAASRPGQMGPDRLTN